MKIDILETHTGLTKFVLSGWMDIQDTAQFAGNVGTRKLAGDCQTPMGTRILLTIIKTPALG